MILDSNILIAALIRDSIVRRIIIQSKLRLFYPEMSLEEIQKHKEYILRKSRCSSESFNIVLETLLKYIEIVPLGIIKPSMGEAERIIGKIDPGDIVFIAAALTFQCPIWTDDKDFDQQKTIKTIKTKDMLRYLGKL
ncbi:MAG TPA: PIN domain-containing protein [Candidatus Nanoarchaeia archaeon]|nr:PIN domain-containing protein [Candidatus Nanoarchaeia archaeon]